MAQHVGTVTFTATVDPTRSLDDGEAIELLVLLLDRHEHAWTADERARVQHAMDACRLETVHLEPD